MLFIEKHDITMRKIVADIYSNQALRHKLAFKGGTCLYFFYNLDRFSTDLDFNLVSETFNSEELNTILTQYLSISEKREKHFTWFWSGSYEKGKAKIKVEISKRDYPDTYEIKDFYGYDVKVMSKDCMFAHKLCAIMDRKTLANRDLYDAYFMFKQDFPINEEIIKIRTGKSTKQYFEDLLTYIERYGKTSHSILEGLGEVLDEKQKIWVKDSLLQKLMFEFKIRI